MKTYANMTIPQFKESLGITGTINLEVALDKENKETGFLRSWDNTNRIGIAVPKELVPVIKSNPDQTFVIMHQERTSAKGNTYRSYFIFMGKSIVASI